MLASAFDLHLLWELRPSVCVCVRVLSDHLDRSERTLRSNICHGLWFVFFPHLDWCVVATNIALGKGRKRAVKYLEMDEKSWASVDIGIVGI